MKDLIRSPLQFVRLMTQDEWQDLMLRENHRELQRIKRRALRNKPSRLAPLHSRSHQQHHSA